MISYPAGIPQPTQQLSGSTSTPVMRTDLPSGLVVQEGRFATALRKYSLSWSLTRAQLGVFEEWYQIDLAGGVLLFELLLHSNGTTELVPVRFADGGYTIANVELDRFQVQASVERLTVEVAPTNRTPAVPVFQRLGVDPAESQVLTLHHRNAVLTLRPVLDNLTTLRIFPPTSEAALIYFGVQNLGAGDTLITSRDTTPLVVPPTPTFPGSLPFPERRVVQQVSNAVARLEMDSGHPRQWATTDGAQRQYDLSWELTLAQMGTFCRFFFEDLKSGSNQFWITLDADGLFAPVLVRAIGGTYTERYLATSQRFVVSLRVDRVVAQTVTPTEERPYPVYYSPAVNVYVNRKITTGDAGKLFIVHPPAGQTISLHIYSRLIEFGLLIVGLGNVLITRGPFILNVGSFSENMSPQFGKANLQLIDILKNIGTVGSENIPTTFPKAVLSLLSVIKPLGTVGSENIPTTFPKAVLEIKTVLEDLGAVASEAVAVSFPKSTLTLDIP
jgi:hypothetical protein